VFSSKRGELEKFMVVSYVTLKGGGGVGGRTFESQYIVYFIYPTDAQIDCSKNVKIYMRGAPTCFGFSQPPSGSYYMCFAKVVSINNQLKYVVYRITKLKLLKTNAEI
jgi:hypothetical protein